MKPSTIKLLSEIQHVLELPDMYIGSTVKNNQQRWVLEDEKIILKEIEIIPGIIKLFDEVISNSIDEAFKTDFKFANKIFIKLNEKEISIKDNGRGLNLTKTESGEYQAVLAFTKLRAGSNFNKGENISIGKFGVGVSLVNIFSNKFYVKTVNSDGNGLYLHSFNHNSAHTIKELKDKKGSHGTLVEWELDFDYFKLEKYSDLYLSLFRKRIYDLAMIFPEINFFIDGKRVKTHKFQNYVQLLGVENFEIYEEGNLRISIFPYEENIVHSFINGIETLRGGTHVDIVLNFIANELRQKIQKKYKFNVAPLDIKNKIGMILSCQNISNVKFDSQTKERVTNSISELNQYFNIDGKFINAIFRNECIINSIIDNYILKEKLKEKREVLSKQKKSFKKSLPKLIDANSRNRKECKLFLTEGDSALGSLIKVRDVQFHGGLPLRGKILNVYSCSEKEVINNSELRDIMAAVGLSLHHKAENIRFGEIVLLTDQDVDGNSITGLLLNFFYKYWPELFENGIIKKYISPIIIATKDKEIKRFYTLEEYEKENLVNWNISYNKGLGSLSDDEYSRMINTPIEYIFSEDDITKNTLKIVFGDDANLRKVWLK